MSEPTEIQVDPNWQPKSDPLEALFLQALTSHESRESLVQLLAEAQTLTPVSRAAVQAEIEKRIAAIDDVIAEKAAAEKAQEEAAHERAFAAARTLRAAEHPEASEEPLAEEHHDEAPVTSEEPSIEVSAEAEPAPEKPAAEEEHSS